MEYRANTRSPILRGLAEGLKQLRTDDRDTATEAQGSGSPKMSEELLQSMPPKWCSMRPHDPTAFLNDIVRAGEAIRGFIRGRTFDDYSGDLRSPLRSRGSLRRGAESLVEAEPTIG